MKTIAIIQARMTSTRLPGKIIKTLGGKPSLINIIERISRAENLNKIIVATSDNTSDNIVEELCVQNNINCFRGSLENVLERFYMCAKFYNADVIIRFTGDNPLIDPQIINDALSYFNASDLDYLSYKKRLPLGMSVEIFSFKALEKSYLEAKDSECLEHVTPYMIKNTSIFKTFKFEDEHNEDNSDLRFTMDTIEDYEFIKKIYDFFASNNFSYEDVINLLKIHPEWTAINRNVKQTEISYKGEKN